MRIDWLNGGRRGDCGVEAISGKKWVFGGRISTVLSEGFVEWFDKRRGWPVGREDANFLVGYLLMDAIYIAGREKLDKSELLDRWGDIIHDRLSGKSIHPPLTSDDCHHLAELFWESIGTLDPEAEERPAWQKEKDDEQT